MEFSSMNIPCDEYHLEDYKLFFGDRILEIALWDKGQNKINYAITVDNYNAVQDAFSYINYVLSLDTPLKVGSVVCRKEYDKFIIKGVGGDRFSQVEKFKIEYYDMLNGLCLFLECKDMGGIIGYINVGEFIEKFKSKEWYIK